MSLPITSRPLMVLRLATSATLEIGSTPQGTLTISICASRSRPTAN